MPLHNFLLELAQSFMLQNGEKMVREPTRSALIIQKTMQRGLKARGNTRL
jgi:hypothetical protein